MTGVDECCERCGIAPCACHGPEFDKGHAIYFSSKAAAVEYLTSLRELAELQVKCEDMRQCLREAYKADGMTDAPWAEDALRFIED